MKSRLRPWGKVVSLLILTSSFASASVSNCVTAGSVLGCWYYVSNSLVGAVGNCPSGFTDPTSPSQSCGYYYKNSSLLQFNGAGNNYGWHKYDGSDVQSFLNRNSSATNLTWAINSSDAGIHYWDGTNPSITEQWRSPTNDYGYFLTTNDRFNSPGITVCGYDPTLSGCSLNSHGQRATLITEVAFYWGSVDPWDKIGFCYGNGSGQVACDYLYGSSLPGFTISDTTGVGPTPNTTSIVVDFSISSTSSITGWNYITFTSCSPSGRCLPAFELDNFEYSVTTCCSVTSNQYDSVQAPVPEPSEFGLLSAAALALAGSFRGRLRLRQRT